MFFSHVMWISNSSVCLGHNKTNVAQHDFVDKIPVCVSFISSLSAVKEIEEVALLLFDLNWSNQVIWLMAPHKNSKSQKGLFLLCLICL